MCSLSGTSLTRALPGAIVEVWANDGLVIARSVTGPTGSVAFNAAQFRDAAMIVACSEGYYCGFVRHDNGQTSPSYYRSLAPLTAAQIDVVPAKNFRRLSP
jgi:hypothetical protein